MWLSLAMEAPTVGIPPGFSSRQTPRWPLQFWKLTSKLWFSLQICWTCLTTQTGNHAPTCSAVRPGSCLVCSPPHLWMYFQWARASTGFFVMVMFLSTIFTCLLVHCPKVHWSRETNTTEEHVNTMPGKPQWRTMYRMFSIICCAPVTPTCSCKGSRRAKSSQSTS